jgi:hypothetical protein
LKQLLIVFSFILVLSACGMERGIPSPVIEDNQTTQSESSNGNTTNLSPNKRGTNDVSVYVESTYPLIDVVKSSANQQDVTRIFQVENKSIEEVAKELLEAVTKQPIEISENTGNKQVLVYERYFATLTTAPGNEANTLIEIATYGFVRDNYQPDFFDGLLVWWFLDEVLDVDDWGKKQKRRCASSPGGCYGTYGSSGKGFKGPVGQPSLRGGSSNVRGGGPGTGK